MPNPIVIDLSHHNTVPESFEEAKAAGIVGVIHKASEGGSYVDDKVDSRFYLAQQAGLLWGLYHFMRPGDQTEHAAFFVDVATNFGDENTLLAVDHEDPDVSLADLKVFLDEVVRLTGRLPVIYSGHVLKEQLDGKADPELDGYLLWLADYSAPATLPPGFKAYWLWQYTDSGQVPGVTPPTDLNDGDVNDVVMRWSGSAYPVPEPEPDETPEVVIDITATEGVKVTVQVNGDLVATVY